MPPSDAVRCFVCSREPGPSNTYDGKLIDFGKCSLCASCIPGGGEVLPVDAEQEEIALRVWLWQVTGNDVPVSEVAEQLMTMLAAVEARTLARVREAIGEECVKACDCSWQKGNLSADATSSHFYYCPIRSIYPDINAALATILRSLSASEDTTQGET